MTIVDDDDDDDDGVGAAADDLRATITLVEAAAAPTAPIVPTAPMGDAPGDDDDASTRAPHWRQNLSWGSSAA
jgi:hypothetical protein